MDLITYSLCRKYTDDSLSGVTTIKGKNCQIQSIDTTTHTDKAVITFAYYDNDDVLKTSTLNVPYANGKNIKTIASEHIEATEEDDGYTKITITANDDTTSIFNVPDGVNGNGVVSALSSMTATTQFITFDMDDGSSIICSWTRLPKITTGFEISTEGAVDDTKFVVGDMYINLSTLFMYVAENVGTPSVLTWKKKAELKGDTGDSVYKTWLELNPSGTKAEFIAAMSGDAIQMEKVWAKPDVRTASTEVNKWYFYQDNDNASQHYLRNFIDSGSYITDRVKIPANCQLEDNTVYYWDAYLTGYKMCITLPSDITLYRSDVLGIQYDLTNAKIPSVIRAENKAIIFKVNANNDWSPIATVTGANITRVADADLPSGAVALSSAIGVDIKGKKLIDELTNTTAWRVMSNYSTTAVIPAGHNCVWNGSKYINFTSTIPINVSALSSVFSEGVALFTDEYMSRGWVIGKNKYTPVGETEEITEECIIIGIGAHLTYTDSVGEGVTDLSTYFNESIPLGIYKQTIYIGVDKSHCDEVTLNTGSATAGAFVTETTFNEVVNPKLEWSGLIKAAYTSETDRTVKNVLNGTFERTTSKHLDKNSVYFMDGYTGSDYSSSQINGAYALKNDTVSANKGIYTDIKHPLDNDVTTWSNTVKSSLAFNNNLALMFDAIYPIGAIAFGVCPTWGTWEAYNAGGYLCCDTSLEENKVLGERLPNVRGFFGRISCYRGEDFAPTDKSALYKYDSFNTNGWDWGGSETFNRIGLDASKSGYNNGSTWVDVEGKEVYKDTKLSTENGAGYNIEVKGKNIKAWVRIA